MSEIRLYYTSVSCDRQVKKNQQHLLSILDSKGIAHTDVDIAQSNGDKEEMRRMAGSEGALPPQICNGSRYCGDYEAFLNAVEEEKLTEFLQL